MIKLKSTKDAIARGVKIACYGQAGAGKTYLCSTTGGQALIISAEAGLMSLRGFDIPVIEVKSMTDLADAYQFVANSAEAKGFDWICLDSISEIGETVLAAEKAKTKDPRQAYGSLQDLMGSLIRGFRDLPDKNVYFSAKMDRVKDEVSGAMLYSPSMPGAKLGQSLAYFFDEVFAYRLVNDEEGKPIRTLQTGPCLQYYAKDRSGSLDHYEYPDLSAIINKINQR